jgi:hypothetical protein
LEVIVKRISNIFSTLKGVLPVHCTRGETNFWLASAGVGLVDSRNCGSKKKGCLDCWFFPLHHLSFADFDMFTRVNAML